LFTEKEERINKEKEEGTYKEKVREAQGLPASTTGTSNPL